MKFQLERIALFSDAVFAIAITLMMIEIKAPHLPHEISFKMALAEFLKLTPTFVGTILSFFLIGVFWKRHHQLMKYMAAYDEKVIKRNLAFLVTIAFIPFSTSFVFENITARTPVPLVIYNINYILACVMNYRLFTYVLNPSNGLRVAELDEDYETIRRELTFPLFVYTLVLLLAFVNTVFAPCAYGAFALEPLYVKRGRSKSIVHVESQAVQQDEVKS